jgi:hypothetical protein
VLCRFVPAGKRCKTTSIYHLSHFHLHFDFLFKDFPDSGEGEI